MFVRLSVVNFLFYETEAYFRRFLSFFRRKK